MPIPVAHGEGRTEYQDTAQMLPLIRSTAVHRFRHCDRDTPQIRTGPKGD